MRKSTYSHKITVCACLGWSTDLPSVSLAAQFWIKQRSVIEESLAWGVNPGHGIIYNCGCKHFGWERTDFFPSPFILFLKCVSVASRYFISEVLDSYQANVLKEQA